MRLVGKPAVGGQLGEGLLFGDQFTLGFIDLALEEEVLGGEAHEFGEPAVEVEGGQVDLLGDVGEGGGGSEFLAHEPNGGEQAGDFRIGLEVAIGECGPVGRLGLEAEEDEGSFAEGGEGGVHGDLEGPEVAIGVGEGGAIGDVLLGFEFVEGGAGLADHVIVEDTVEAFGIGCGKELLQPGIEHERLGREAVQPGQCLVLLGGVTLLANRYRDGGQFGSEVFEGGEFFVGEVALFLGAAQPEHAGVAVKGRGLQRGSRVVPQTVRPEEPGHEKHGVFFSFIENAGGPDGLTGKQRLPGDAVFLGVIAVVRAEQRFGDPLRLDDLQTTPGGQCDQQTRCMGQRLCDVIKDLGVGQRIADQGKGGETRTHDRRWQMDARHRCAWCVR